MLIEEYQEHVLKSTIHNKQAKHGPYDNLSKGDYQNCRMLTKISKILDTHDDSRMEEYLTTASTKYSCRKVNKLIKRICDHAIRLHFQTKFKPGEKQNYLYVWITNINELDHIELIEMLLPTKTINIRPTCAPEIAFIQRLALNHTSQLSTPT